MTSVNGNNFNIYQGGICQPAGMPIYGAPVVPGSPELFVSAGSIDPSFSPMGFMNQSNGPNGIDGYPSYEQGDCGCMPYPGMGGGNGFNGFQLMALFQMMMGFLGQLANPSATSGSTSSTGTGSVPAGTTWQDELKAGRTMTINLDSCNFTDNSTGEAAWNSQLEQLKAGQTYTLQYDQNTNTYTTSGYNKVIGENGTYSNSGGDLANGIVDFWNFNDQIVQDPTTGQLQVVDPRLGVIGHATIS